MSRMTAMDAAVSILVDEGVEVIFGIPGAGILGFYQSLMKSGKIKHYVTGPEINSHYCNILITSSS